CITLRASTERPVTVTEGTNVLAGDDLAWAERHLESILRGERAAARAIRGWDGHAAERIVEALLGAPV
ncbi:MAG TPA: UDP-N-acetylglucosamine 2-epimerase, partial [Kofleriaceae bacterium]|nr:UDP-N-acetylglucosamine 2-epimerase [Kofleriaceae bacterium]